MLLGLLALAFRLIGLNTSFELWVDEMVYADLGGAVARFELPNLPDGPFFLHPPGYFLIEGAAIRIFGLSGDSMTLVYQLRWIGAILGAVTVALAFLLVKRTAGTIIGLTCAALLALEPFALRNNSRVFLETTATCAALAGLVVLVYQLSRCDGRPRTSWLVAAGLCMGYSVLTKDVFALFTVAPIVLAMLWRRTIERSAGLLVLGAAVVPYAVYLALLMAKGLLGNWLEAKAAGLWRMLGFVQVTGFNAPEAPSLASRIIDLAGHFATSYALLLVCPLAGAYLCWRSARPERRLVGLVAVCIGSLGAYSAAFGTFEEQYGYPVMIAGVLALGICAAEVCERRAQQRKLIAIVGTVFFLATAILGARAEFTPDSGFRDFRTWAATNLPPGARVGVTNSTAELAFRQNPGFGVWPSAPTLLENDASYILTQSLPTSQGYGYAVPGMLTWLNHHARPVFRSKGLTNGETVLWHIDRQELEEGARLGVGDPAIESER